MGALDKFKARFGPAQTDHKRLADIKLTQERLNKKPEPRSNRRDVMMTLPKARTVGGAGSLGLIGGIAGRLGAGAFNLAKKSKGLGVSQFIEPLIEFINMDGVEAKGPSQKTVRAADAKPGDTLNPSHVNSTTDSYTKQTNHRFKNVFEKNTTVTDLVTGEVSKQYTRQKTKTNKRGKTKSKFKRRFEKYDSDGNLTYREKTRS